jgi:hypothetical protein
LEERDSEFFLHELLHLLDLKNIILTYTKKNSNENRKSFKFPYFNNGFQ